MLLFGGLNPITTRVALDVLALLGLSYATATAHSLLANTVVLLASCIVTLVTAGLTNRWTLTLPMLPILLLQGLRRVPVIERAGKWAAWTLGALSVILILFSSALSVLFPAVELPPIQGPYNVGIVDFYVPFDQSPKGLNKSCASLSRNISVRILYPTLESPSKMPYLHPDTADQFCRQTMRFGAPGPLKRCGWFLHQWRLARVQAKRNAQLLPGDHQFPVIAFSHGLGGTAELYSYQTMALAAHGNVVVSVTHQDGSAPVVKTADGSMLGFDFSLGQLSMQGKHAEYVRARRSRTDYRVEEFIAAIEHFLALNEKDQMGLHRVGVSFRGRLQADRVSMMGHSFGGATALTAAKRRPDLVKSVIAHEPAVDWMPDDARRSLLAEHLLVGLPHKFHGGTGGFEASNVTEDSDETSSSSSLHDLDLLVLFSDEWREKKWGESHILLDMHSLGRFGSKGGGVSQISVIDEACHSEFSDTSMIVPVWLGRGTGLTGKRNPIDTAVEIEGLTRAFLNRVHASS